MMRRRNFVACAGMMAASSALLSSTLLHTQTQTPVTGSDYRKLDHPAPVDTPAGKIEVLEFFWYNCPHCHVFEPTLAAWVKQLPRDVVFKRVPIAFQDSFVPQQRLYYGLEEMGLADKLHTKVFAAIHTDKQNLTRSEAIVDWVGRQGIDKAAFQTQFDSFSTLTKASRATQLQTAYQVNGVPAMGVAGRYYTDGDLAKTMDRVLQVVEYLADNVRHGR